MLKRLAQGSAAVLLAVVVLLALLLGLGRGAMLWLDQDRAQRLLTRYLPQVPITLEGARFGWHRFDPQVRIAGLQLGDSRIEDLVVQVDWLESLWRRALVFAHLSNGAARLRFEPGPDGGFRLAGMPAGDGGGRWRATFEHSDALSLRAALYLSSPGSASPPLSVAVQATNRSARRRWSLRLADRACTPVEACTLALEAEELLHVPLLQSPSLALSSTLGEQGLRLPATLLGGMGVHLERARIRWDATQRDWRTAGSPLRRGAAQEAGAAPVAGRLDVDLKLRDIQVPGGVPFAVALTASGSSHLGYAVARSFDATLTVGDDAVALPELWMRWLPERIQLYTATVDLTRALEQIGRTRADDDPLGIWSRALAIRGQLNQVRLQADLTEGTLAWSAALADGALSGYQGAPTAADLAGDVLGYERGLKASIEAGASEVGFPDVFNELWPVESLHARLQVHWRPQVLALLGQEVEARLTQPGTDGTANVTGRFRLAVPSDRLEQTLALTLAAPTLTLSSARQFVPSQVNAELQRWLRTAPRGGMLRDVTFAYHGYTRGKQGPIARRSALTATVEEGVLRFDERWPAIEQLAGRLDLSGQRASFEATRARSLGLTLDGSMVRVPPGGRALNLSLSAAGDGAAALSYLRSSPLQDALAFVEPDWEAAGRLRISGPVQVPLAAGGEAAAQIGPQAQLEIALEDLALTLPGQRLAFTGLRGDLSYRTPAQLRSERLLGALHERDLTAQVSTTEDGVIRFDFNGRADPALAYRILGLADAGLATGSTEYQGVLAFPRAPQPPTLELSSALTGIDLDLPGELAKDAADRRSTRVTASFAEAATRVGIAQRVLDGSLIILDGALRSGELRLRGTAAGLPQEQLLAADAFGRTLADDERLVITGALAELPLAAGGAEGGLFGETPVRLDSLRIGHLLAGDTDLGAVALTGTLDGPALAISAFGEQLRGRFAQPVDGVLEVDLDFLALPDVDSAGAPLAELDVRLVTEPDRQRERVAVDTRPTPEADPLPASLISEVPAARIEVAQLQLGDDPFGRWSMTLAPEPGLLRILDLDATVRGLTIVAPEVQWSQARGETDFKGELTAGDLAQVLPQWDYEASLATESATVRADVRWPGSPANVNLLTTRGDADFTARDGRFLEIDSGNNAVRIFSLLNFSAFTKRMNLDFSDVTGRGIAFDELIAPVTFDRGDLRFREPMAMEGTGSKFRLSGTVDLDTGALNNEMVVTLPLTKGLPWYAAYVALANPLAGLGVLVGERMLRKPLEQFSSARYRITGTLDDPDARLVSIFDNDMSTELPADGVDVDAAALENAPVAPQESLAQEEKESE
ncbi:MAG: AsmA-like C-terminal region-containing protein [Pseudomonadota bacterium]